MNTSVVADKVVSAGGINNLNCTPKQAFTAWTSCTLPFGLKLGGGARFVDSMQRGTDSAIGTPASINCWWVYEAMAAYSVSKKSICSWTCITWPTRCMPRPSTERLSLQQGVCRGHQQSGYRYTPGTPRSPSLAANFRFWPLRQALDAVRRPPGAPHSKEYAR